MLTTSATAQGFERYNENSVNKNGRLFYIPDITLLAQKFRFWHVEPLLNQAADIIDKCLEELREYRSLDYSWHQFQADLRIQEKELLLDKSRPDFIDRDLKVARSKELFLNNSEGGFGTVKYHADKLYNLQEQHGQGHAGWTKAGQNMGEVNIAWVSRTTDRQLNQDQIAWATSDILYQTERLRIREESIQKKKELSAPGQPLHLERQKDLVFLRMERNYKDAVDRAVIAKEGLKVIYGYDVPIFDGHVSTDYDVAITSIAIWVRNAIEWLVAYAQIDQAFTKVVSLKTATSDDLWEQLQQASDRFSFTIHIPSTAFESHYNVRLRGIGLRFIGKAGIIPWSANIRVPEKAVFQRETGIYKIDQKALPKCLVGRIENNESFRAAEVCGLISLANASPMPQSQEDGATPDEICWKIELVKPKGTDERFSRIDDLLLELNLIGYPY